MNTAAPTAGSAPTNSAPSGGDSSGGSPSSPGSSAPTQTPSQGGPQSGAPNGNTQTQGTPAPAKRDPVLIKHRAKAKIGEQEHEIDLDIDIAEHIANSKHKFKADGADHELTLSELLERAPLAQGAFRRMTEGTNAKKEAEALVQKFQGERAKLVETLRDPKKALGILERTLGRDRLLQAVEAMVADEIATAKLTPEQRAQRDQSTQRERDIEAREQQLKANEEKAAQRKRDDDKREADAMIARWREEWPKHLEAVKVKSTQHTLKLMAGVKSAAKAAGYPISDEQAAKEVAREVQQLIGGLDGKALQELAPNVAQDVQRTQIDQLNSTVPGRIAQMQQGNPPPRTEQKPPPATLEEFRDQRREEADEAYQRRLRGVRR